MADRFKRPPKLDFEPREQEELRSDFTVPEPDTETQQFSLETTKAEEVVQAYDNTIVFIQWLESLMDDRLKNISVDINFDEQPEVFMAMQRVFGETADPRMDYRSFVQVLDAIEEINTIEGDEAMPELDLENEFISQVPQAAEIPDDLAPDMDIGTEDEVALEEALQQQVFTTTGDLPTLRRFRIREIGQPLASLERKRRWYVWRISWMEQRVRQARDNNRYRKRIEEGLGDTESVLRQLAEITQYKKDMADITTRIKVINDEIAAIRAGERDEDLY